MALQIRKIGTEIFRYVDTDVTMNVIESKLVLTAQLATLTVHFKDGSKTYKLANSGIVVYDDSTSGSVETFATIDLLVIRLAALGYKWL